MVGDEYNRDSLPSLMEDFERSHDRDLMAVCGISELVTDVRSCVEHYKKNKREVVIYPGFIEALRKKARPMDKVSIVVADNKKQLLFSPSLFGHVIRGRAGIPEPRTVCLQDFTFVEADGLVQIDIDRA
jgi:hypothetical protein